MKKFLLALAIVASAITSIGTSHAHAAPPSPVNCDGTWRAANGSLATTDFVAGSNRFRVDTYLYYNGAPDNAGHCVIQYAWAENMFQLRNNAWSTNVDSFVKHHLRFRIWVCGALASDTQGDATNSQSGWAYSGNYYYGTCGPQADNTGYAYPDGSYTRAANYTAMPVPYVHLAGW